MNRQANTPSESAVESRPTAHWLEEAFSSFRAELLGMLVYIVGNVEDAQDALQDAFLNCLKLRADAGTIENRRAWIFRVALNAGRDLRSTAWRRRRRSLEEGATPLTTAEISPPEAAVRNERLERVRRAIHQLRAEEQEVFLLREDGRMTYEQIAASIGIPLGTVKTRMRLALANLREAVEGK